MPDLDFTMSGATGHKNATGGESPSDTAYLAHVYGIEPPKPVAIPAEETEYSGA